MGGVALKMINPQVGDGKETRFRFPGTGTFVSQIIAGNPLRAPTRSIKPQFFALLCKLQLRDLTIPTLIVRRGTVVDPAPNCHLTAHYRFLRLYRRMNAIDHIKFHT